MNASEKQRDVANFVHSNRIGILGLVETNLTQSTLLQLHRKMFSNFDSIDTCDKHPRCRVWLLRDRGYYDLLQHTKGDSFIHAFVQKSDTQERFWLTLVYAPNEFARRLAF